MSRGPEYKYDLNGIVVKKRIALKESQKVFAERFGVKAQAVGYWEQMINRVPPHVMEFCKEDWVKDIKNSFNKNLTERIVVE